MWRRGIMKNDKAAYVSLARDFALKRSVSENTLYNLVNGATYDLSSDQGEFVLLFDGKKTAQHIMAQYDFASQKVIDKLLHQLESIGAVKFSGVPHSRKITQETVPDKRLEFVHLEASGKCNMFCAHCYQAKHVETKEELAFGEILSLLDQLQKMQISNIGISGGEPLMMPNLDLLMEEIEKRDIRISALFTNGLLINESFIKTVKSRRSDFPIFVSLDSIHGGTLNFRGVPNKKANQVLDRILKNIRLLIQNNVRVVLNTVVNAENISLLGDMYQLIRSLGIDSWRIGFPKMTARYKEHSDRFNVKWSAVAERCLGILKYHIKEEMPFHLQIEYLFRPELLNKGPEILSAQSYVCDYEGRRSECCIKPNGDVVSCAYCSDLILGNIKKAPIWDIWYSPAMKNIKTIRAGEVAACRNCDLLSICGTGCRANAHFLHSDFYNAKDDYACKAVLFFKEKVAPLLKKKGLLK
jgi:radical SAM protein with 4Fe4S-binding SPASM domain